MRKVAVILGTVLALGLTGCYGYDDGGAPGYYGYGGSNYYGGYDTPRYQGYGGTHYYGSPYYDSGRGRPSSETVIESEPRFRYREPAPQVRRHKSQTEVRHEGVRSQRHSEGTEHGHEKQGEHKHQEHGDHN